MDREPRWFERGLKKAIYILINQPTLNKDGGRYKLSNVYDPVLTPPPKVSNSRELGQSAMLMKAAVRSADNSRYATFFCCKKFNYPMGQKDPCHFIGELCITCQYLIYPFNKIYRFFRAIWFCFLCISFHRTKKFSLDILDVFIKILAYFIMNLKFFDWDGSLTV